MTILHNTVPDIGSDDKINDKKIASAGKFITLEGSEGVGKTTSLKFIQSFIESAGHKVLVTREPGGTPLAEDLRATLLTNRVEKVEPDTELLLMFAARCQHVNQVIKPALASGTWVVCDRFVDASYAYQGGGRGLGFERIKQLEDWSLNGFGPDMTILLDMSVEDGMTRTRSRGAPDRFETEKMAFYEKIRKAYLQRARQDSERIHIVDASPDIETVQRSLKQLLQQTLRENFRETAHESC
ncbi:dTMP kinase [Aliikangiella coralliicola]|uniref:Thymidylate kinase n=1 Tax=Aliikangiella coralliicola TaxID=2592383 RepID=A0A545UD77_9GAMM|nr:dTMP kinase [Aliikangiella coralliicola]TQV87393.1 dTMP kinase [Aliikangiella coralliicola]